jgi:hypothetical protein
MDTNVSCRRIDTTALFADEYVGEAVHPDGLTEASIDLLLEEVDRELASNGAGAEAAYRYDFNDQRRVSRAHRRAARKALWALPAVWTFNDEAA